MILYIFYRVGYFLAMTLPLGMSYWIACRLAGIWCRISHKDRRIVEDNIKRVLDGNVSDNELHRMTKEVFRNFAKYLVDFFRFSLIDETYIKRFVNVEGLDNLKEALSKGKGVIALSAHIGNWELGGAVLSSIGYPTNAVVLSHENKYINNFFKRQRIRGKMKPIEIGITLKACYITLKSNGVLALMGDRDFTKNGMNMRFFGDEAPIPKGPAVFSYRIGSAIVPTFMLREADDTFRLVFDRPIYPDSSETEDSAMVGLTKKFLCVIEDYIKKYPTQWYVFRDIWKSDEKDLRPDTVI